MQDWSTPGPVIPASASNVKDWVHPRPRYTSVSLQCARLGPPQAQLYQRQPPMLKTGSTPGPGIPASASSVQDWVHPRPSYTSVSLQCARPDLPQAQLYQRQPPATRSGTLVAISPGTWSSSLGLGLVGLVSRYPDWM